MVVCKRCGAYRTGKQWHARTSGHPIEDAIRQTVLDSVRVARYAEPGMQLLKPVEAEGVYIEVVPLIKKGLVKVTASGKVHPLQVRPKAEEATIKVNLEYSTCKLCSLKRARHHEAILQLRGAPSRVALFEVQREIENLAARSSQDEPSSFIADVKERHGGLDFYLSSVSLARKMAALLKGRFGASVVESAKFIGQTKDGRKKYRISILARLK